MNNEQSKKEINIKKILPIPTRHLIAMLFILVEYAAVIAIVVAITYYVQYFYIAVALTQLLCAINIINSSDNPDYKVPWLFVVMLIPIIGFMTYFMFYSRRVSNRQLKRLTNASKTAPKNDNVELAELEKTNSLALSQAKYLKDTAKTHLYQNTKITYFACGEKMFEQLIKDLEQAKEFIFLDYFIIQQGFFWNTILKILQEKVDAGVEVKVVYDDIGSMTKLPGKYYKTLRKHGIDAVPFGILKGQANNEFNNRNHRKITIIDGKIGYTGGINLADEYINHIERFGYWKDVAIRLEGEAVDELTRLFLFDFCTSYRNKTLDAEKYFKNYKVKNDGYCIPFGDGPKPVYDKQISKTLITTMLGQAEKYVYITTPYLIIDDELTSAIENASLRGVDVKIITPHIPDKKLVFSITRSSYERLMRAGIKIYEYEPGFIHAKTYLCDDKYAIIGTINLDYRSLVHHYENAVWIYNHEVIKDIKKDFEETKSKSIKMHPYLLKEKLLTRTLKPLINIFSSLL